MAYTKINISAAPKKQRVVVPRFARTQEWRLMQADIEKGLKPDEALQICLTDDDKAKYRIKSRRTIARFIQKYLVAHRLAYTVKSFRRDSRDYVLVQTNPAFRR